MQKSMIQTIKTVEAAVTAVIGQKATDTQVLKAIAAIESLKVEGASVATKVVTKAPAKAKAKPKRKKYVNWRQYNSWFNVMFDGQPHVITFQGLATAIPHLAGADNKRIHKAIWSVARSRGIKASIQIDNKLSLVRIEAIKA